MAELIGNSATPGADIPIGILTADIAANTLVIPAAPVPLAPLQAAGQFRSRIGSELLLITGNQNTAGWTSQRGIEGTVAAIHKAGDAIYHDLTRGALLALLGQPITAAQLPPDAVRGTQKSIVATAGDIPIDLSTGDRVFVMNGPSTAAVKILKPTGAPAGPATYIEVWVKGKFTLTTPGFTVLGELGFDYSAGAASWNSFEAVTLDGTNFFALGAGSLPSDVMRLIGTIADGQTVEWDTTLGGFIPVNFPTPPPSGIDAPTAEALIRAQAIGNRSPIGIAAASAPTPDAFLYASQDPQPGFPAATLGEALSTAAEIPSIKLTTGHSSNLVKGQQLVLTSGIHTWTVTLSADVASGTATIPIVKAKPTFAFPATTTTVTMVTVGELAWSNLTNAVRERAPVRQALNKTVITSAGKTKVKVGSYYLVNKPGAEIELDRYEGSGVFNLTGEELGVKNTSTGTITVTGRIDSEASDSTILLAPGEAITFEGNDGPVEYRVKGMYRPIDPWVPLTLSAKASQGVGNEHGVRFEVANTVLRLRGRLNVVEAVGTAQTFVTLPAGHRPPVETLVVARLSAAPFVAYLSIATTGVVKSQAELLVGSIVGLDNVSFAVA